MAKRKQPFWYERLKALEQQVARHQDIVEQFEGQCIRRGEFDRVVYGLRKRLEAVEAMCSTLRGMRTVRNEQHAVISRRLDALEARLTRPLSIGKSESGMVDGNKLQPDAPKCPKCGNGPENPSGECWCSECMIWYSHSAPASNKPAPALAQRMEKELVEQDRAKYAITGHPLDIAGAARICARVASECPKCGRKMVGAPGQEKCEGCDAS
jgi:hypothetical protein